MHFMNVSFPIFDFIDEKLLYALYSPIIYIWLEIVSFHKVCSRRFNYEKIIGSLIGKEKMANCYFAGDVKSLWW